VAEQGRERLDILQRNPAVAGIIVAGHLDGTRYCRTRQAASCSAPAWPRPSCLTATVPDLKHPPIDHVCVSEQLADGARVAEAWEGTTGCVRLSDHSGVVVEVAV
jgi:endonuclease/exonuclease/phosphatase family metal-dependent hydrolase